MVLNYYFLFSNIIFVYLLVFNCQFLIIEKHNSFKNINNINCKKQSLKSSLGDLEKNCSNCFLPIKFYQYYFYQQLNKNKYHKEYKSVYVKNTFFIVSTLQQICILFYMFNPSQVTIHYQYQKLCTFYMTSNHVPYFNFHFQFYLFVFFFMYKMQNLDWHLSGQQIY